MAFIKKEDRENIEKLNEALGTRHRVKPYDFNNSNDIIAATIMATAEYADMSNYWSQLYNIDEAFDESLEYYRPAGWINLGLKGTTEDEDIDDAIASLNETLNSFEAIMKKAEQKCIEMWKIVLLKPKDEVLKYFFGEVINFDRKKVEYVLEEQLIEICDSMEYDGVIENSAENFAKILKECLVSESKEDSSLND